MSDVPTPDEYYGERLPSQFNRMLGDQERAVADAQRVLDGMRAVNASIRVDVSGEGGGTFYLNVEAGRMAAGAAPSHDPFLTLIQDRDGFERLTDASLARLLKTLREERLVDRHPEGGTYVLGDAFRRVARAAVGSASAAELVQPVLVVPQGLLELVEG